MTLLNLEHFSPAMLFALCRTISALEGPTRKDVVEWLSPAAYRLTDAKSSTRTVNDLIRGGQILRLVEGDGEELTSTVDVSSIEAFRLTVLQKALARENNTPLLGSTDAAQELTWALTWTMSIDPTLGPFGFDRQIEVLQAGIDPKPFRNADRWRDFVAWALFLGFGWNTPDGFVPDPTVAVLRNLDAALAPNERLRAADFVAKIADAIPVLDGGAYRLELDSLLGNEPGTGRDELSGPLSLALLRLDRRGVIALEKMADGEARVATLNERSQVFHFVSRPPLKPNGRKK